LSAKISNFKSQSGTQADIFIKTPEGEQYIAQVWPGAAVYPDWFAKGVVEWWTEGLKNWTGTVAFDGVPYLSLLFLFVKKCGFN
jgi:alpha-glucosidase (family GH31 glycosyl hydrolase)